MIDEKQLFIQIFEKKIKTCAFTGHRVIFEEDLRKKIKENVIKLIKKGVEIFYNGMAVGFDLLCAEIVLSLKIEYPQIKLIACIPFYNQEKNYNKKDKERYVNILKQTDETIVLSEGYYKGCTLVRNKYMADHADVLVCYLKKPTGGTAYTVKYFSKKYKEKEIVFL